MFAFHQDIKWSCWCSLFNYNELKLFFIFSLRLRVEYVKIRTDHIFFNLRVGYVKIRTDHIFFDLRVEYVKIRTDYIFFNLRVGYVKIHHRARY